LVRTENLQPVLLFECCADTKHKNIKHQEIQHYDIQHYDISIMTFRITTFGITIFSITTFSITTISKKTHSIMTLGIMAERSYPECRLCSVSHTTIIMDSDKNKCSLKMPFLITFYVHFQRHSAEWHSA
jgi:hypothetical protein